MHYSRSKMTKSTSIMVGGLLMHRGMCQPPFVLTRSIQQMPCTRSSTNCIIDNTIQNINKITCTGADVNTSMTYIWHFCKHDSIQGSFHVKVGPHTCSLTLLTNWYFCPGLRPSSASLAFCSLISSSANCLLRLPAAFNQANTMIPRMTPK